MNETLGVLIQNLQQACASKNWEELAKLDEQIKHDIQVMISSAQSAQQKEVLSLDLKAIQKIYDLVIDGSQKHQLEIASELKKISKDRNAANSYLGVSQY